MAACDRCRRQIAIPCDRDKPGVFHADRRSEMNRVISAQAVKLGEFAGEVRQRIVDPDHVKLGV